MTTVVLSRDGILADCRLTLKIKTKDQKGKEIEVVGTTDSYTKIGSCNIDDKFDDVIDTYVIFGDVETAEALFAFVKAVGLKHVEEGLKALSRFSMNLPKIESGFAWVDNRGEMNWITINRDSYHINNSPQCKEDGSVIAIALGSGKAYFDVAYEQSKDIVTSFMYAIRKDEQSSSAAYDHWDRMSGVTNRLTLNENTSIATLEELLACGNADGRAG